MHRLYGRLSSGRVDSIRGDRNSKIRSRQKNPASRPMRPERDALTGLPNRAFFMDCLEKAIASGAQRGKGRPGLLIVGMDRFKLVNGRFNHAAGDRVLMAFSQRLSAWAGPGVVIGRLGGDEFAVLLNNVKSEKQIVQSAGQVLELLVRPFDANGHEVFATASVGAVIAGPGYQRFQDVLRDADTALYQAKASGKNCHQVFSAEMHRQAVDRMELETDLRHAAERGQLELYYQPIIETDSGKITAFEALVRWNHPVRGRVMPADFISLAEETGLILNLGLWVLHEACRQAAQWRARYPAARDLAVSVNLSPKQFNQPDLCAQVQSALKKNGLPSSGLMLEITESVVVENPKVASVLVRRLRDMGIKVNIDDFGTGYSSLANLHHFPVDTMKIDRSFIARLGTRSDSAAIVATIISLAHNLNMTVTAEGVETDAQLALLRSMDCEHSQGFLLSAPVPAAEAGQLLGKHASLNHRRPVRKSA